MSSPPGGHTPGRGFARNPNPTGRCLLREYHFFVSIFFTNNIVLKISICFTFSFPFIFKYFAYL